MSKTGANFDFVDFARLVIEALELDYIQDWTDRKGLRSLWDDLLAGI